MTAPDSTGDGLAAALIQISAHAERISGLDAREASHYQDIAARLSELAADVASLNTRLSEMGRAQAQQSAILASLDGLDHQVAALATQLAELAGSEEEGEEDDTRSYRPIPAPRWWKLTGPERDASLDRLRAWVDRIYRPSYGHLAATLPACWEQHPLCLHVLDWLSELWSVLYLNAQRNSSILAAQAEWQTRLLPAAAGQMANEASGCNHESGPSHQSLANFRARN